MYGPGQTCEIDRWVHYPATVRSAQVTMSTTDTEYSWEIPTGTREFSLIMQNDTIKWRFSANPGEVATGGGSPRAAGQSVSYQNGFYTGTVYFAHSESSTQVMRVEYAQAGG